MSKTYVFIFLHCITFLKLLKRHKWQEIPLKVNGETFDYMTLTINKWKSNGNLRNEAKDISSIPSI